MVKIPMFTLFRLDLFEALKVKILPLCMLLETLNLKRSLRNAKLVHQAY